jgi:signal transduction histidine kinase
MAAILIVDDNLSDRRRLKAVLRRGGHRVVEAGAATQALALCRAAKPDLIISGILMPVHDGYEFLRQLRADGSLQHIAVIFYTAYYKESNARAFAEACGVALVLPKHAEPKTILDAVDSVLKRAGPTEATAFASEFDREHTRILTDKLFASVTELESSNADLRLSGQQLRRLAERLSSAQEDERTRIARHLHDELGQALTLLKLNCAWVAGRLRAPPEGVIERLQSSIQVADETIRTVRRLATELRPGILDLGIAAAIEWQAEEFQSRSEIQCIVDLCDDDDNLIDPGVAIQIFRIFQEIITNIVRHASATTVTITLKCEGAELLLEVGDNGKGITSDQIANHNSLGLLGMRERAMLAEGTFWVGGNTQGGTTIRVRVPIRASPEALLSLA